MTHIRTCVLLLLLLCRSAAGPCDVPEVCTAAGTCPEDEFVTAGTLCRWGQHVDRYSSLACARHGYVVPFTALSGRQGWRFESGTRGLSSCLSKSQQTSSPIVSSGDNDSERWCSCGLTVPLLHCGPTFSGVLGARVSSQPPAAATALCVSQGPEGKWTPLLPVSVAAVLLCCGEHDAGRQLFRQAGQHARTVDCLQLACGRAVVFCVRRDLLGDTFWPTESAQQLSEAGTAARPEERGHYYTSRRPGSYPSSGAYGRRSYDWPDCMGSCFAGACRVDQTEPGCCYAQTHAGAAGDTASTADVAGGATAGFGSYREHAGGPLVCWRDEDDPTHIA